VAVSLSTPDLHQTFLDCFDDAATALNDLDEKPLLVDMLLPLPPRLRLYMYNLVGGVGTKRDFEYKAVLRLRGHPVGEYRSFDHSGGRLALLVAYRADLDVFVMWDASLHPRFKNGGNIQVRTDTVMTAAATGYADQERRLSSGLIETVMACTSSELEKTLVQRIEQMGGTSVTG